MAGEAGKGSIPRKIDKKKYDENFDNIYRRTTMKEACEKVKKLRKQK